jgi:hypothetical protein
LKAKRGRGSRAKAVCFTEKPLAALKDTILGSEARVRRGTRALGWSAYGVMFEKSYLQGLGVRPVLHLDDAGRAKMPEEFVHRVVSFEAGTNWLHEREWRAPGDVPFDPTKCVVLVPTFEQADVFRAALARHGKQTVRGFLPLLDLFAAL